MALSSGIRYDVFICAWTPLARSTSNDNSGQDAGYYAGGSAECRYQVEQLNQVLEPLLDMMRGEDYAAFLEIIPAPEEETDEEGNGRLKGKSYGDVGLLMTKFKSGLNQFFQRRI